MRKRRKPVNEQKYDKKIKARTHKIMYNIIDRLHVS